MLIGAAYVVNTTQFSLQTYSDSGSISKQSTILFTNEAVQAFSKRSLFNIISNATLNISGKILSRNLTERELSELQTKNVGIMVDRCDFSIDNFKVMTNFSSTKKDFIMMKAVFQQRYVIKITNMQFITGGYLFDCLSPLSMIVQNVDIDYYRTSRGFYIASY